MKESWPNRDQTPEGIQAEDLESIKIFKEFEKNVGATLQKFDADIKEIEKLEHSSLDVPKEKQGRVQESLKSIKNASIKFTKFVFLRLLPAYIAYAGIAELNEKPDGKFSERDRARKELKEKGITSEQESAYRLGMSEALYRGIIPWGYQNSESNNIANSDAILNFPGRVIFGREVASNNPDFAISMAREDAWKLMLGLPQEHNTFGISDYQPENSKTDKFYYKINGFEKKLFFNHFLENKRWNEMETMPQDWIRSDRIAVSKLDSLEFDNLKKDGTPLPSSLLELVSVIKKNGGSIVHSDIEGDLTVGLMGHFKLSCGEDEKGSYISYYDTWDLDNTVLSLGDRLTRSYEIYDRIYYDPKTGDILENLISK